MDHKLMLTSTAWVKANIGSPLWDVTFTSSPSPTDSVTELKWMESRTRSTAPLEASYTRPPPVVVSITVKPGDVVSAGDRLAVLEAMKMEMKVVAPFSGKVRQIFTI